MRVGRRSLLAGSLPELAELIECAHDSGDQIELLVAYYPTAQPLERSDLEDLLGVLRRND